MDKVKLKSLVLKYNNGKEYVLKGEELETYLQYTQEGIWLMKIHGYNLYKWDKLMHKIYRHVGIGDEQDGE